MTIKNATECSTGTITCDDVVQNTEQQSRKKCSKDINSFPDDSKILAHASEVLKQVEGAGLEKMVDSVEKLVLEVHYPMQNQRSAWM